MSEIFSKILKDKNGKVLNVGSKYKQPEWGAETSIVDILPEAEYTASEEAQGAALVMTKPTTKIVGGNAYAVNYNGTNYNAIGADVGDGAFALGNAAVISEAFPATDDPFVIMFIPEGLEENYAGAHALIVPLDGSTTFTLSIKGESETVHKIPAKYVVNNAVMRVNVSEDMVADMTYNEVVEAIEAGAHVYLAVGASGGMGEGYIAFYNMAYATQDGAIAFYEAANKLTIAWASDGTIAQV